MGSSMTFVATGDSFITRRLPDRSSESFRSIANLIGEAEFRFTNLEVTTHRLEGFPFAFSGGTWAMAQPEVLADLQAYGFNIMAWANNHTMDYAYGGLEATRKYLDEYGICHAGVGMNLAEASQPVYLDCPSGRVALVAATSTFHESWMAGEQRPARTSRRKSFALRDDIHLAAGGFRSSGPDQPFDSDQCFLQSGCQGRLCGPEQRYFDSLRRPSLCRRGNGSMHDCADRGRQATHAAIHFRSKASSGLRHREYPFPRDGWRKQGSFSSFLRIDGTRLHRRRGRCCPWTRSAHLAWNRNLPQSSHFLQLGQFHFSKRNGSSIAGRFL